MKRFIVALMIALLAVTGCSAKKKNSAQKPAPKPQVVCTQEYNPVCGVDGNTYPNACIATEQKGVAVATQGECPPKTTMTDAQRKFLVWLLQKRMSLKMPAVLIRPLTVQKGECAACSNLYYAWGEPKQQTVARVQIDADKVTDAHDTTGYDYLTQQQGTPTSFPELKS